jgi:ribonuclease P protein subunit RPR2
MAKAKLQKGSVGAAQSHIRARIAYLHKASAYILSASSPTTHTQSDQESPRVEQTPQQQDVFNTKPNVSSDDSLSITGPPKVQAARLPRQYLSQMRGVSLKSQLRLPQDIKRSVCKRCDILLVPGSNCTEEIENSSRGKKKPWADVCVIRCTSCGTAKRFPQTSKRSSRLSQRPRKKNEKPVDISTKLT